MMIVTGELMKVVILIKMVLPLTKGIVMIEMTPCHLTPKRSVMESTMTATVVSMR
jgi:hypothetical protein